MFLVHADLTKAAGGAHAATAGIEREHTADEFPEAGLLRGCNERRQQEFADSPAADLLVVIASLAAIVVIALLPAIAYNPYVDLVPAAPDPDRLLAVALLAVPAVTASLVRVDHARHRA